MQQKMLFKQAGENYFFFFFVIIKVCPLMEVATSLIWFCWAGTMGNKKGGIGLSWGKYITIHGEREKEAAE